MSIEDDVRRDLERANRWARWHGAFIAVCGALVGAAYIAFMMWRESRIWER